MYFIATDSVVTYEFDARSISDAINHLKKKAIYFKDKEITLEYYKHGERIKQKIQLSRGINK